METTERISAKTPRRESHERADQYGRKLDQALDVMRGIAAISLSGSGERYESLRNAWQGGPRRPAER